MFLIYVVTKHLFCFAFLKFIIFFYKKQQHQQQKRLFQVDVEHLMLNNHSNV